MMDGSGDDGNYWGNGMMGGSGTYRGTGMMGGFGNHGMMGGHGNFSNGPYPPSGDRLTMEKVEENVLNYMEQRGMESLELEELMEFQDNFYAQIKTKEYESHESRFIKDAIRKFDTKYNHSINL